VDNLPWMYTHSSTKVGRAFVRIRCFSRVFVVTLGYQEVILRTYHRIPDREHRQGSMERSRSGRGGRLEQFEQRSLRDHDAAPKADYWQFTAGDKLVGEGPREAKELTGLGNAEH